MKRLLLPAMIAIGVVAAGCSQTSEPPGYTKEDFAKSTPPPEYRGPGQPGAPGSGPAAGPAAGATPPPEILNGAGQQGGQ